MSSFLSRENRTYRAAEAAAGCQFEWVCNEPWRAVEGKKDGIICEKIPTIGVYSTVGAIFSTAFSHGFTVFFQTSSCSRCPINGYGLFGETHINFSLDKVFPWFLLDLPSYWAPSPPPPPSVVTEPSLFISQYFYSLCNKSACL
jgi:hypothetical protein